MASIPECSKRTNAKQLLYSNLLILANVFWRAIYSFYQSHSTILYNYNIYRCRSVCLYFNFLNFFRIFFFTSNDGDELRRKHRMNVFNTGTGDKAKHWPIFNLLIDLALQEYICLNQSLSVMTHTWQLIIAVQQKDWQDCQIQSSKSIKTDTHFHHSPKYQHCHTHGVIWLIYCM